MDNPDRLQYITINVANHVYRVPDLALYHHAHSYIYSDICNIELQTLAVRSQKAVDSRYNLAERLFGIVFAHFHT